MPDTPLRPDELETYKTDVQTEDEPEPAGVTPGSDARPWVVVGLALLVAFVVVILLALAQVAA